MMILDISSSTWSSTPSCRYDFDCPSLETRNTGCIGFLCSGGQAAYQRDQGKCLVRYGHWCKKMAWLRGLNYQQRQIKCVYRECAECLVHSHCPYYRDSCNYNTNTCYDSRPSKTLPSRTLGESSNNKRRTSTKEDEDSTKTDEESRTTARTTTTGIPGKLTTEGHNYNSWG